jgi:hypothetical protein
METKRYASRKFVLTLLTMITATALLVAGAIDGDAWYKTMALSLGLYVTGNVAQKAVE